MAGMSIRASSSPGGCDRVVDRSLAVPRSCRAIIVSLAAQTAAMPRVGRPIVGATVPDPVTLRYRRVFEAALREFGWIEGKTIAFERRFAIGDQELLRSQARELVDIRVEVDLEPAFADLAAHDVQAVWVYGSTLIQRNLPRIVQFCASRRLPDMYIYKEAVALGARMSYGVDVATLIRRSALYIDKILRGAKPVDLPVELPARYELVLNLKTARALSLTIPQPLLLRADEVIQ